MDFRKATDILFERVSHDELASALGVSVATIRQARLGGGAIAHRNPPEGWETAVRQLALEKAKYLNRLAAKLG